MSALDSGNCLWLLMTTSSSLLTLWHARDLLALLLRHSPTKPSLLLSTSQLSKHRQRPDLVPHLTSLLLNHSLLPLIQTLLLTMKQVTVSHTDSLAKVTN